MVSWYFLKSTNQYNAISKLKAQRGRFAVSASVCPHSKTRVPACTVYMYIKKYTICIIKMIYFGRLHPCCVGDLNGKKVIKVAAGAFFSVALSVDSKVLLNKIISSFNKLTVKPK